MLNLKSQRGLFAHLLLQEMQKNDKIRLITADLGYIIFDDIQKKYPKRFINTGAAETLALDMAVGMAYQGLIPVVYSITPFLLFRAAETIRTYINYENLNVKLIGSGRDSDYAHDGFSHYAGDDKALMSIFTNIRSQWPTIDDIEKVVPNILNSGKPEYLNLSR